MFSPEVSFAFSAGTVAAFNPCGFALLPAYLSVFLAGQDDEPDRGPAAVMGRAAVVAASVVAGFVVVFGIAGLLINQTSVTVQEYTPWISLVIGLALIPVGVAILRGWSPKVRMPAVRRAGADGGLISMFWFGVSYATVSLSCTIPAFLVAVVGTFSESNAAEGMLVFAAYTAGMAAVLVIITVVVATARQSMLGTIRRVLPYINGAAGVLAMLAGAYVAYYGYYEIQVERGGDTDDPIIEFVGGTVAGRLTTWVDDIGTAPIVIGALAVLAVLALLLWQRARSRATGDAAEAPEAAAEE